MRVRTSSVNSVSQKTVVIAGMGDTGILAAIHLSRHFNVVGISTKPLLVSGQELGARLSKLEEWKRNYLMKFAQFRRLNGVRILQGKVVSINDRNNSVAWQDIHGEQHDLEYDALLIATGTTNGFWRTAEVQTQDEVERSLVQQADTIRIANKVVVIGGGASAVSAASNVKENYPDKSVHLYFSRSMVLPEYHEKTRQKVTKRLEKQGVRLFPKHRAVVAQAEQTVPGKGEVQWETGQAPVTADCLLWAVGHRQPNNHFIPKQMLGADGYVNVDSQLRVPGTQSVFSVGDIADTDSQRGSARNAGFLVVAHNIRCHLNGKQGSMKRYSPSKYRWGSILGVQHNGMIVFAPKGGYFRFPRPTIDSLLFPILVRQGIYKGVDD